MRDRREYFKEYSRKYREKNPDVTKKNSIRISEKVKRLKLWMVDYKGGRCLICGYNRYMEALDFHHRDPKTKHILRSNVTKTLGFSEDEIKTELDGCDLLCANCHRETHAKRNKPDVK